MGVSTKNRDTFFITNQREKMRPKYLNFLIPLIAILFIASIKTYPQLNDYNMKFGIQFNGLFPDTEFEKELKTKNADFKFSYLGRAFFRFELITQLIEFEFGAGYGSIAGVDYENYEYRTELAPFDIKLILSPFKFKAINPYAYGGVGILPYRVKSFPKQTRPSPGPVMAEGWNQFYPVGGGVEIRLTDDLAIDVSGGYNYAFTDNLNYYNNLDVTTYTKKTKYDGYFSAAIGISIVRGCGNSDDDLDGLLNNDEENIRTDPENPDTDGDGLTDGDEVLKYKSNPLNVDTDTDGLKDGDEVYKSMTNPIIPDTDGDGLNDGVEVNQFKTNPLKIDTDDDGLNDNEEITIHKTNPVKADTDGEGLIDGDEIKKYKTDPLRSDTDGDELFDGEELKKHKTNPLKKDSDDGSVDDFTEIKRGTNPLDASDDVVKIGVPIVLEGVTFETNKADITPESAQVLKGALKTLTTYGEIQVEISGHTDNVGSKKSNIVLSQKRADSVRNWLIDRGIDAVRIIAKGYGPDQPIASNDTPENKRKNRRIEFKRIK